MLACVALRCTVRVCKRANDVHTIGLSGSIGSRVLTPALTGLSTTRSHSMPTCPEFVPDKVPAPAADVSRPGTKRAEPQQATRSEAGTRASAGPGPREPRSEPASLLGVPKTQEQLELESLLGSPTAHASATVPPKSNAVLALEHSHNTVPDAGLCERFAGGRILVRSECDAGD